MSYYNRKKNSTKRRRMADQRNLMPLKLLLPKIFNEEQQMVKEMCASFLETEVLPIIDRIDKLEQD